MKRKICFFTGCVIWAGWISLVIFLQGKEIDVDAISIKKGTAIAAHCVESRSVNGVKFKVLYVGSEFAVDDYISLPPNVSCNRGLINRFRNTTVKISYYENYYLGLEVDGQVVRSIDESIGAINDKSEVIGFTLFMTIVISLFLYLVNRSVEKSVELRSDPNRNKTSSVKFWK